MPKILIVTGDGGESYEALYAVHRFQEEGWEPVVAAPARRRLHLVMHDFQPGWDTYIERRGYGLEADLAFDQVRVNDYAAILLLGGRAPEYLRNDEPLLGILRDFDRAGKWVFAICHGIQVLAAAGLASGKHVTCYHHVRAKRNSPAARSSMNRRCATVASSPPKRGNRTPPSTARSSYACGASQMPLDPEIAAYLETQKHLPPRSAMDIAATRERLRQGAALAGPPPALHRVENLVVGGYLRARQYWPAAGTAMPLVVFFHGGRFISGDLTSHDTICRMLALASGCRVLAVDYRLAPEHRFPAAAQDAALAVEWALGQGIPVAVAGDSAGANLAAGAALANRGQALRCQLLIYPMIDATCSLPSYTAFAEGYGPGAADMRRGWREYLPEGADPRDPLASPLFATTPWRRAAGAGPHRRIRHPARRRRSLRADVGYHRPAIPRHDPRLFHHAGYPASGARRHVRRRRLPQGPLQ